MDALNSAGCAGYAAIAGKFASRTRRELCFLMGRDDAATRAILPRGKHVLAISWWAAAACLLLGPAAGRSAQFDNKPAGAQSAGPLGKSETHKWEFGDHCDGRGRSVRGAVGHGARSRKTGPSSR